MSKPINWSLFESQEKEITLINDELYSLRKEKYPKYLDSYYKHYKDFGFTAMIGDLYRKFDRLKNMAEIMDSRDEIISNKKEILDQYYDLISYLQLQLYFMKNEYWKSNGYEMNRHKCSDLTHINSKEDKDSFYNESVISKPATGGYVSSDAIGKHIFSDDVVPFHLIVKGAESLMDKIDKISKIKIYIPYTTWGDHNPDMIKSQRDEDGYTVLYFTSHLTPEQKEELKALGA